MKKKNLIIALTLVLSLGVGVTAYADSKTPTTTGSSVTCSGYGFGKITGMRGYDFMTNILENKFGISDSDISTARNSGKTMYDIAKDKGITEDQFKSAMVEERTKAVDEAIKNGSITKEQGENIKSNIKESSSNCTPGKGPVNDKRGGMGIGLAICAEILKKHSFSYGVTSIPNSETEFYFVIPNDYILLEDN